MVKKPLCDCIRDQHEIELRERRRALKGKKARERRSQKRCAGIKL